MSGALLANEKLEVQTDSTKCAFGKWLNGDQCKHFRTTWPEFDAAMKRVVEHHEELHESAIKITDAADHEAKVRIYETATEPALEQVARCFGEVIALEEEIIEAGRHAHRVFESETLPAPAETQAALKALQHKAVTDLTGMKQANAVFASKTKPALQEVRMLLGQIAESTHTAAAAQNTGIQTKASRTRTAVGVVGVIAIVVGIFLALFIARSIIKVLTRIVSGLNEGADQVDDAAKQVSSASQQLAEGASEQASSLEETSSALEEMAAMTRTNAENAKEANNLSGQARDAARNGDTTIHRLNEAMTAINDSSGQISKIIKVIEEIAFQTNLLALNAAVEAARAGEHGKGFAVVADEVRNLAQRAAQAARETTGLIEDSVNKAKEGTDVAGEVGKALGAIVGDVTKVTDLVDGISKASDEQAQGVDQVNTAVSQMDKVTQQNASGAEESASAAEELAAQATAVKSMVQELSALVGGASSERTSSTNPSGNTSIKRRLNVEVAHQQKEPEPVSAKVSHPAQPSNEFMSLDEKKMKDF
ncbi:MAG: CZB domain-containing protein [Phycisphaerales bacterium]|nr:MAG: CZB domain-containing protein [Phycisphaerales bacterium]